MRSLPYTPHAILVGSFSYTSRVRFSEESLLHSPCCCQWVVLGTLVFNHACMPDVSFSQRHQTSDVVESHVGRQKSYSTLILDTDYTPHRPLMFPVGSFSYTNCAILCGCLSYTACAVLCGECVLHSLGYLIWGIFPTRLGLFCVGNLSDTPHSILCGEFVVHTLCYFMWGVSYMPHACLCGEFLLHAPCCFM